jgi:hypothetical protein
MYKTIILPVVLHSYETRSLTLREEHRVRVFENRMLRRIFGPKRDEVTGEWRKLVCDLSFLPSINDQVDEGEMGGACSMNGFEKHRL